MCLAAERLWYFAGLHDPHNALGLHILKQSTLKAATWPAVLAVIVPLDRCQRVSHIEHERIGWPRHIRRLDRDPASAAHALTTQSNVTDPTVATLSVAVTVTV